MPLRQITIFVVLLNVAAVSGFLLHEPAAGTNPTAPTEEDRNRQLHIYAPQVWLWLSEQRRQREVNVRVVVGSDNERRPRFAIRFGA